MIVLNIYANLRKCEQHCGQQLAEIILSINLLTLVPISLKIFVKTNTV